MPPSSDDAALISVTLLHHTDRHSVFYLESSPLISNLFISFLNIPRGDQKRFEILQLISGVLKFTDEQREQAGLIRRAGAFGAMTPSASGSRSPSMEQMRQPPPEPREVRFGQN